MSPRNLSVTCALPLALLFLLTPMAAVAAAEESSDVTPELRRVLDGLDAANKKVQDVKASVVYLREIPLLDESQESKGSLLFRKPNLIRVELGKPRNEEIITDGKKWWVVSHNDKQVEIYEAASGKGSAEASFLTFGYGQSSAKLLESYKITLIETKAPAAGEKKPTRYRLRFVPRDKTAPARFARIEVELADDLFLPDVIVLHESEGEIVHTFRLQDIKLNTEVKDKEFNYEPPKGYSVLTPEGAAAAPKREGP